MPPVTAKQPGNGTGTLSFIIPQTGLDVETVYVSIDATAAGSAVTAELTITDQGGVVIARKPQTQTIAIGGAGSATWALRLDDSGGAGTSFPVNTYIAQLNAYTTPGIYTYNVPANAVAFEITCTGAGGGGGGGAATIQSGPNFGSGGCGGGGGSTVQQTFYQGQITGPVTVTVGAGGAGGAGAPAGANNSGTIGANGANSSFGSYVIGYGGGGGGFGDSGGTQQGGSGAGTGSAANHTVPGNPAAATSVNAVGGQGADARSLFLHGIPSEWGGSAATQPLEGDLGFGDGGDSLHGGPSGGCGGGWNSTSVIRAPAKGGAPGQYGHGHGAAAGTNGASPTAGGDGTFTGPFTGQAGGGGGCNNAGGTAARGGNGSTGAGGGGGGEGNTVGNGGAGGNGGDGAVFVVAFVPPP